MKVVVLLITALFAAAFAASAAAAPLEAYARAPLIDAATLSPDGQQLAVLTVQGAERSVAVRNLATRTITARAASTELGISSVRWIGNDHLLVITSQYADPIGVTGGQMPWRRAHILDAKTSKLTPLTFDAPARTNAIVNTPMIRTIDGRPALFVETLQFAERQGAASLFRTDLNTGRTTIVAPPELGSRRWLVDGEGRAVAQEQARTKPDRWILKVRDQGGWRDAHTASHIDQRARIIGLGPTGRSVIFATRADDGEDIWNEASLDGSPVGAVKASAPGASALIEPQTGFYLGSSRPEDGEDTYHYLDEGYTRVLAAVRASFAANVVEIKSWSANLKRVVAWIDRPGASPAYELVDVDAGRSTLIADVYPGLTEADVGLIARIRLKAADGMNMVGYLTRPPGRTQAKKLPLIVLPHTSEADRVLPNYAWLPQALASRGYAVLQVNTRGSSGYGRAFTEAGRDEWGRKMQSDLSDGVRALANIGVVDGTRVCIVGVSYGGYAALSAVTQDLGVYRCAAAIGGVFDLPRQAIYSKSTRAGWPPFLAAKDRRPETLAKWSPINSAPLADGPVLLVHAQQDIVSPPVQSRAMADALRAAGKSVTLTELAGDDHWLATSDTRRQALSAVVGFLEKHNPPD